MRINFIFQILAVILIGFAAVFLWLANSDGVFVALVLSACCFFLNIRFQAKERLTLRAETIARAGKNDADEMNENQE